MQDTVLGPTTCALSTIVNREQVAGVTQPACASTLVRLLTENHCDYLGGPPVPAAVEAHFIPS